MVRVEKHSEIQEEISKLKSKSEDKPKEGHTFLKTVALLCFILVVIVVLAGAWFVAATGLVRIPVLTTLAYEKPEPTRVVEPGVPIEDLVKAEFEIQLTERLEQGMGLFDQYPITFRVPEDSLTSSLRSSMEEAGVETMLEVSLSQVVVLAEGGLELYLPIKDNAQETAVKVVAKPYIDDQDLRLEIIDMRLGSAAIPKWFIGSIVNPVIQRELEEAVKHAEDYVGVLEILYSQGEVQITGEISIEASKEDN